MSYLVPSWFLIFFFLLFDEDLVILNLYNLMRHVGFCYFLGFVFVDIKEFCLELYEDIFICNHFFALTHRRTGERVNLCCPFSCYCL